MDPATSPQLPILTPPEVIDASIESSLNGQEFSDGIATATATPSSVDPQTGLKQGGLRNFTDVEVSANSASEEDEENGEGEESLSEDPSEDIRVSYASLPITCRAHIFMIHQ